MINDSNSVYKRLSSGKPSIVPSLLQCDFGRLADEIHEMSSFGAACVHWDVMDGHFVPNLTYGPTVIEPLRRVTDLVFDAHLMMSEPQKYLDEFLAAGCDIITVHLEAVPQPGKLLEAIRRGGALAGLAINPPTPVHQLEKWLDRVDLVLMMSVMPGFGGQSFDDCALDKLRWARATAPPNVLIQVDGGINATTIERTVEAGADLLVVGSAIFRANDRKAEFSRLTRLAGRCSPLPGT